MLGASLKLGLVTTPLESQTLLFRLSHLALRWVQKEKEMGLDTVTE